jgi:hypothetical protein
LILITSQPLIPLQLIPELLNPEMSNALPVVVFIGRWTMVISLSFLDGLATLVTSDSFGTDFIIHLKSFWRVILNPYLRWVIYVFGSETFENVFRGYQFCPDISLHASTSFDL